MAKKRKSKKWGPGNPLWEWKNKNKSSTSSKRRRKNMAKKRKTYKRSRKSNFLSGKGMLGAKIGMGVIGQAGAGILGAEIAKRFMPGNQLASAGAGILLGGPIGGATAYLMPNGINSITAMLGGGTTASSSGIPIYG